MTSHLGSRGPGVRVGMFSLLLFLVAVARADAGSDWLAKLPPPPKTLDEARAQCGEDASYATNPWIKFEQQRQAAEDKLQKGLQASMSDPKKQADIATAMMSQSMDPGSAMAQQQYAQYLGGLGSSAPGVTAEAVFAPAYTAAQGAVDAILKAQQAKLGKCPTLSGEAGTYPIASCEKPIDADAEKKKADVANKYLADAAKSWPQYLEGARDYFKKVNSLPPGVDPDLMQVKMQRDGIPLQELGAVKDVGSTAAKICENANGLKSRSNPGY